MFSSPVNTGQKEPGEMGVKRKSGEDNKRGNGLETDG